MSRELKPQHHPLCRWLPTEPCTCGLDRLRAEVAALKRALRTIADGAHFVGAARHVAAAALSPKRAKPCPSPDCVLAAGHARPCVVEVAAGSVVRAPKRGATKRGRKRPTRKTTTSGGA